MTYYIGQIELFAGNFAPGGTVFCDGQLLSPAEFPSLFSLIGTAYGGDGRTTFGIPDLRGRIPISQGSGPGLTTRQLGSRGGQEMVSLNRANIPAHNHRLLGRRHAPTTSNSGVMGEYAMYAPAAGTRVAMSPQMVQDTPPSPAQPHQNLQPFQVLNYIICVDGVYPQRN